MRLSRFGIGLSLVYIVPSVMCIGTGLVCGDAKSSFTLFQLPIAFQVGSLHALGWSSGLPKLSWGGAYLLLGTPIVLALYLIGHGVSWFFAILLGD
jgi:hypothetical protein